MKCEDIIRSIDRYFDEDLAGLPADISDHMEDCAACRRYYAAAGKTRTLTHTIRESEPALNKPEELIEQIMGSIEDKARPLNSKGSSLIIGKTFSRMIAAAAIILFALFSYEQYIILDKVNRLETQVKEASTKQHWEVKAIRQYRLIKVMNAGIYQNIIRQEKKDRNNKLNLLQLLRKERSEQSLLTLILNNGKSVPVSAYRMDTGH